MPVQFPTLVYRQFWTTLTRTLSFPEFFQDARVPKQPGTGLFCLAPLVSWPRIAAGEFDVGMGGSVSSENTIETLTNVLARHHASDKMLAGQAAPILKSLPGRTVKFWMLLVVGSLQ